MTNNRTEAAAQKPSERLNALKTASSKSDGLVEAPDGEQIGSVRITKAASIVAAISAEQGATIEELMLLTGWQAHSVRGFLSGTARKKMGLSVVSEIDPDGERRYRIATPETV